MNALLASGAGRDADGRFQLTPDDARDLADLYRNFRRELLLLFATLPPDAQKRYSGYADALLAYEKDLTRDCKGGAAGGCLTEDDEPAPPAKGSPKAGQAPRDLAKALEAADTRENLESAGRRAPPLPRRPRPARGSFAAMAAGYPMMAVGSPQQTQDGTRASPCHRGPAGGPARAGGGTRSPIHRRQARARLS